MKKLATMLLSLGFVHFINGQTTNDSITVSISKFYNWYLEGVKGNSYHPDPGVFEGEKGYCKFDIESHIMDLMLLDVFDGTFYDTIRHRYAPCSTYLSNVKYKQYVESDAYIYDEECMNLYYYNYLWMQEYPEGIEVKSILIDSLKANAEVFLYTTESDGSKNYWKEIIIGVVLNRRSFGWRIADINRIK